MAEVTGDLLPEPPVVREGVDFYEIAEEAEGLAPDLLIGHSKGYHLAKRWQVPLVRVGFPIHDRFGGQQDSAPGLPGGPEPPGPDRQRRDGAEAGDRPVGYGYM